MTFWNNVLYVIINIFLVCAVTRFLDVFLDKSKKNLKRFILTGMLYWVLNSICHILYRKPALSLLSSILGLFIVAICSYKDKMWKKLLAVFSVLAISVMVEEIIGLVFNYEQSSMPFVVNILTTLFIFLAQIMIEKVWSFKEKVPLPKRYYYCMLLPASYSVVIIVLLVKIESEHQNTVSMFIVTCIMLVLDILMFYFFDKMFSFYNEIWEKRFLDEKIAMYENQLEIIRQSKEKEHALRHDLKNHLFLLSEYEKSGRSGEVLSYIEKMEQFMTVNDEIVNTGNEQVDIILNYMLKKVKKTGAELDVKVNIPKTEFCSVFDLNVLLTNLLENAIEALENCSKKSFQLIMELDRGILHIRIENSFDGKVKKEGNRYITRKENVYAHGMGLKNVQEVVEKYNGMLEITQEENIFLVNAILYVG